MESAASQVTICLKEASIYRHMKDTIKLPTFVLGGDGVATAFSIGEDYWIKSNQISRTYTFVKTGAI